MKIPKLSSIFRYLYLWLMLFFFTTELPLVMGLTTRRFAVIVAIITMLTKQKEVKEMWQILSMKKMKFFLTYLFFVAVISLMHFFTRGEGNYAVTYSEPWFYIYIILYILIFSLYCAVEFRSLKEFVWVIVGVYLFQSLIVLRSVVDPAFRTYIFETFNKSIDDKFIKIIEEGTRIMGINLAGAAGSVKMCTSALALVALKMTNRIKDALFWILYMVIMLGTVFVGRTGILVEIGLLVPMMLHGKGQIKSVFYLSIFATLLISIIMYVLSTLDPVIGEALLEWMTESFSASDRAVVNEGVLQGGVPPFSVEFIFGTGMDTGYMANGILYTSDSGLIRTYMAYGVVGFIFYYLAMYNLLTSPKIKNTEKGIRNFFYTCVTIAFIIEYKEPFMMKYMFPWAILTCMILYLRDNKWSNQQVQ